MGKEYDTWYGVASNDLERLVGRPAEDVFATAAEAVGIESCPGEPATRRTILASWRGGEITFGTSEERDREFIICPRDVGTAAAAGIGVLLYDTEYDLEPDEIDDSRLTQLRSVLQELFRTIFDPATAERIVGRARTWVTLVDEWDDV